ncbi:MAG: Crp/Fnr family transcriptional regulator [Bacteriovoracaceae bacterium]|nr:Crp/Fnr family transcriptional regulator [Bacteriovoracaceae bacterium]
MHKTNIIACQNCLNKQNSVFCGLKDLSLENVSHNKIMNNYQKGHTIFFQGNPPFGLFCINSGKVKISKIGNDGKESIVRIAGPGDILGHRSLFSKENYTATATVIEDAAVCFVDKKFIFQVINDEPSLAINVIEKLSKEMGAAESRSASMFQKNVSERLAELFLTLKKAYGVQEEGRWRLNIKLTREEIASIIGTANETVIRFITDFKNEGLLAQEGKTIYILNVKKLEEFANLNG